MTVFRPYEILYTVACGETCLFWAFGKNETGEVVFYRLPGHMSPHMTQLFNFALPMCFRGSLLSPLTVTDKDERQEAQALIDSLESPRAFLFVYDFLQDRPTLFADADFYDLFDPNFLGTGLRECIENLFVRLFMLDPFDAQILYTYGSMESLLLQVQSMGMEPSDEESFRTLLTETERFSLRMLFFTVIRLYEKSYMCVSRDLKRFVIQNGFLENDQLAANDLRKLVGNLHRNFSDEIYSIRNCLQEVFRVFQYYVRYNSRLGTGKRGDEHYLDDESGQFVKSFGDSATVRKVYGQTLKTAVFG